MLMALGNSSVPALAHYSCAMRNMNLKDKTDFSLSEAILFVTKDTILRAKKTLAFSVSL
jgi:hypothetical protein